MDQACKTIAVGSRNPVKLQATEQAFRRAFSEDQFRAVAVDVPSGVAGQPNGDAEALSGSLNRARAAINQTPAAAYGVGIEGAVHDTGAGMEAFAWAVVVSRRHVGKSRTATFFLPESIARIVRGGAELADAVDAVFGQASIRSELGAIGLLTQGAVSRAELCEQAVIAALIPFLTPGLRSEPVR